MLIGYLYTLQGLADGLCIFVPLRKLAIELGTNTFPHLRRVCGRFSGAKLGCCVIGLGRKRHTLRLVDSGRSSPGRERGELVDEIVHIVECSALI